MSKPSERIKNLGYRLKLDMDIMSRKAFLDNTPPEQWNEAHESILEQLEKPVVVSFS